MGPHPVTARIRLAFVLFVALVLHQSVFLVTRVGDAHPRVLLVVAIGGGFLLGSERGAVLGFGAGMLADLFVQTPFGLSALTYALVAFAVGGLQSGIIRSAWWIAPSTTLAASFAGMLLYALVGALIGQPYVISVDLVAVAAGVAVMNALLAPVVVRSMSWALTAEPESAFAR